MEKKSPENAPTIRFTNLYRLIDICNIVRDGSFSKGWNADYKKLIAGNKKVNVPADDGSQIKLRRLPLKPLDELPEDVRSILHHKEALYLVTSTRYSMHYVGMTARGIPGVFQGSGRFSHHARKMLASFVNLSTNHTGVWLDHAKDRYKDLVSKFECDGEPTDEDLLGDVCIAFGISETDWTSRNHEGLAEDHFRNRITAIKRQPSVRMNSAVTSKKPAQIVEPDNLVEVLVAPHLKNELAKLPAVDQHTVEVDGGGEKIWITYP